MLNPRKDSVSDTYAFVLHTHRHATVLASWLVYTVAEKGCGPASQEQAFYPLLLGPWDEQLLAVFHEAGVFQKQEGILIARIAHFPFGLSFN